MIIRDNKCFCQITLKNLIKIFREVYKFEAFKKAVLVKFDFWGQRSSFEKAALLIKEKIITEKNYEDIWDGQLVRAN